MSGAARFTAAWRLGSMPPMKKLACALAFAALAPVACAPTRPASHPDAERVTAAQAKWCAMLAEADGVALDAWRYRKECLAATPSGSAAYVERLAGCYGRALADYGDDAPDSAAIIDACTTEIMAGADPGDVTESELFQARCARLERCSEVSPTICASAWEQVDPAARAMLTSMYNLGAQAEIAACLRDTACTDDEDAAERACYRPLRDRRAWLPLSLEADPTLAPKVD